MKKLPIALASLTVAAGLAMGMTGEASAKDVLGSDGVTLLKQDVLMKRHSMIRVETINELANSISVTFSYMPPYKSPTIFWAWGPTPDGGEEAIALSDDYLWDNRYDGRGEKVLALTGVVYLYKYNAKSWQTTTFSGERMVGNLADNTTHILYANGTNTGGVKVDYSRCVTAENYLAKKAVATEDDVLECRLATSNPTYDKSTWGDPGEEWYQPYFNGEKLEFTENDKAGWLAAAKAEAEEVNQAWQIEGYSADDGSDGGASDDGADGSDGGSASSAGTATVEDVVAATKSGYQNGYEKGYADGAAGVVRESGSADGSGASGSVNGGSDGELVESSTEAVAEIGDNSSGSVSEEVEVPLLGGECAEWPWWWVVVAAICGLGVGGVGGYLVGRKCGDKSE